MFDPFWAVSVPLQHFFKGFWYLRRAKTGHHKLKQGEKKLVSGLQVVPKQLWAKFLALVGLGPMALVCLCGAHFEGHLPTRRPHPKPTLELRNQTVDSGRPCVKAKDA